VDREPFVKKEGNGKVESIYNGEGRLEQFNELETRVCCGKRLNVLEFFSAIASQQQRFRHSSLDRGLSLTHLHSNLSINK
jgi:hypothetical protein